MNNSRTAVQADAEMNAIVSRTYGTTETLRVERVPRPEPTGNQVRVRNNASVVTMALSQARSGHPIMARLHFGLRKPKWPILGTNFSGHVDECGEAVTRFQVGDAVSGVNVTGFGAHAEYILVSEDDVIGTRPVNLSDEEAVAVFDGAITALPFLRDAAKLRPGQLVLINGAAGAVGTAAVQLAKHYGAIVTAVCSTANIPLVRSLGADKIIDRSIDDFTDNSASYDLIFDAVGKSSFARCRRALRPGGLYLTTVPSLAVLAAMFWTSMFGGKKATILFTGLEKPAEMAKNLGALTRMAEAGHLIPVIENVYRMDQASQAYDRVASGRKVGSAVISLVVQPSEQKANE